MFKIIERKLSAREIKEIFDEIKRTPTIVGYTKKEWRRFNLIFVAETSHKIVGVSALKRIDENWLDLSALFVLEKYRGRGFGKLLFQKTLKWAKSHHQNIYFVSRNPIVIKWAKEEKVKSFKSFFELPKRIKLHIIKNSLNLYRIFEFIRKAFVFRGQKGYVFFIKSLKEGWNGQRKKKTRSWK